MPFGLTNVPSSFQEFIKDELHPMLDIFCTTFLDDILINSNNIRKHKKHIQAVMQTLKEAGLHLKAENCKFHKAEVKYLELIVDINKIRMDPDKVHAVKE
jgi:hypothetical protein